jgi:ankyrin repeat protein
MEMVRLLLDNGAVPGGFELRAAAQHGCAEILKLIIPLAQAEINAANWLGQTPLDLAVQHGHEKCAALLRAAGGKCKGE